MATFPQRARLPLLYASLAVLFGAQTMCTSFGADAPVEGGPDANAAAEASVIDGAPSDAPRQVEASLGQGCAGRDAGSVFCEDFDKAGGSGAFEQMEKYGTGSLDVAYKGGFSAPNAARFFIPAATPDAGCMAQVNCEGASSNKVQTLRDASSHLRLSFRVRLVRSRLDRVFIFFANTSDLQVNFAIHGTELEVNTESTSDAGVAVQGTNARSTLQSDTWTEIELDEKFDSPASVTLRVGGQPAKVVALPAGAVISPSASEYRLQMGANYNNAAMRDFDVLIDDVAVDVLR